MYGTTEPPESPTEIAIVLKRDWSRICTGLLRVLTVAVVIVLTVLLKRSLHSVDIDIINGTV